MTVLPVNINNIYISVTGLLSTLQPNTSAQKVVKIYPISQNINTLNSALLYFLQTLCAL